MTRPRDLEECARRCRCADPEGRQWVYLNAFCPNRDTHQPWEEYGFTQNGISRAATEYQRDWLESQK